MQRSCRSIVGTSPNLSPTSTFKQRQPSSSASGVKDEAATNTGGGGGHGFDMVSQVHSKPTLSQKRYQLFEVCHKKNGMQNIEGKLITKSE